MKISGIFFCIAVLAFLLPFWQITYNLGPATGLFEGIQSQTQTFSGFKSLGNVWVVLTLLIAIVGALTAFAMGRKSYIVPLLLAIIGFIVMLFIKRGFRAPLDIFNASLGDMGIKISLQFGYYMALISFLIAAVLAFLAGKQNVLTKEQISNFIPDKMENAYDKAKSTVTAAGASVLDKVDNVYDTAKEKIDNANLDDRFDNVVDKVKDVVGPDGKIAQKIDETVDKVKDYVDPDDPKQG